VSDELEMILKEAVVAQFKALSWHLPGRTEDDHKKKQDNLSPD
jgi:hypothetical protein